MHSACHVPNPGHRHKPKCKNTKKKTNNNKPSRNCSSLSHTAADAPPPLLHTPAHRYANRLDEEKTSYSEKKM